MFVDASVTDSLVQFATNAVDSLGLVGIFLLMLAESACIPIPSEATMLFAGFSVSEGHLSLVGVVIAGVLGNLAGSWLAYGVGYYGRMELVERNAHHLHINASHLAWADRWFSRYGEATVFFTRVLPIIRTFISLPAGIARMPFWRFTLFTLLGCIPWVFALAFIGDQVGHNWVQWKNSLSYVDYVMAALIVAAIIYVLVRWRSRRREAQARVGSSAGGGGSHLVSASHADRGNVGYGADQPDESGDALIGVSPRGARGRRKATGDPDDISRPPEEDAD